MYNLRLFRNAPSKNSHCVALLAGTIGFVRAAVTLWQTNYLRIFLLCGGAVEYDFQAGIVE
jgi:hypothetical protein